MSLDARLASVELLTLAAMRVRQQQTTAPPRTVTLQVIYAAGLDPILEPELIGERYVYTLPPQPGARPC